MYTPSSLARIGSFFIEGKQLEENEDGSGRKISNLVEIDSTRIVCCFSAGGEGEEAP